MKKPSRQQRRLQEARARKAARRAGAADRGSKTSQPPAPALRPSPSLTEQAAKVAAVEAFDNFAPLRNGLRKVARMRDEWAGIPMPLQHERLVIAPQYPNAQALMDFYPQPQVETEDVGFKERNRWFCSKKKSDVVVFEANGKIDWGIVPAVHHLSHDLSTLGCSEAWGLEQESNAVKLLGTLVRHRQLKQYLLTGMFLESSTRSGLTYMFRKLKPTVVIDARGDKKPTIHVVLCLHAIGYYAGSWAGCMCPTDDVITHLMMMRGDEPMYWRKANQIPPWRPEAGL